MLSYGKNKLDTGQGCLRFIAALIRNHHSISHNSLVSSKLSVLTFSFR